MITVPLKIARLYEVRLEQWPIPVAHRPLYKKWLRYYLDFCHKYHCVPAEKKSLSGFITKLRDKGQFESQQKQAYQAILIYYELELSGGHGCADANAVAAENSAKVKEVKRTRPMLLNCDMKGMTRILDKTKVASHQFMSSLCPLRSGVLKRNRPPVSALN